MVEIKDTIPKQFYVTAAKNADKPILYSKDQKGDFQPLTFNEIKNLVITAGCGFASLGIKRGDHIGIISDNRKEWYITDMALLGLGAVDVPRGCDSTAEEIAYILNHAECKIAFAENMSQLDKIVSRMEKLPLLKTVILFDEKEKRTVKGLEILSFDEVMETGKKENQAKPDFFDQELEKGRKDDLATIIYTSGTTGEPKGVMLTHRNFTFQLERIDDYLHIDPEWILLSVLPIWHVFERTILYVISLYGCATAYSKPVGSILMADMQKVRPHAITSVPRIWEGVYAAIYRNIKKESAVKQGIFRFAVFSGQLFSYMEARVRGMLPQFVKRYRWLDIATGILPLILITPFRALGDVLVFKKIRKKLGGRFAMGISGGGALPPYVDKFFQAAGICLLEGYGMTETAPVLSVRIRKKPIINTVGPILPDVDYKILNKEGKPVSPGHKGVLHVKSEQVMQGYYKRQEATDEVLKDGWLNTGDIVVATHNDEIKILGRAKETIVLLGGENIEPVPIEDQLVKSELIQQAMVVGQDKKFLGALIIPDLEQLEEIAKDKDISYVDKEELLSNPEIEEVIHDEIQSHVNPKEGFKHYERIFRFTMLAKPFEIGKELTQTQKMRRGVINDLYKKEIKDIFH